MNLRPSQVYVSRATRRALSVIARSEGGNVTTDEVAERLLSDAVAKNYPGIVVLQKQIETLEEQMIDSVKPK